MRAGALFLQPVSRACRFTVFATGDALPPPPSRPLTRSRFGFPPAQTRKRAAPFRHAWIKSAPDCICFEIAGNICDHAILRRRNQNICNTYFPLIKTLHGNVQYNCLTNSQFVHTKMQKIPTKIIPWTEKAYYIY